MFTLCMSRGHPPLQDAHNQNNCISKKQIKGGYLLRYRRGLFCKSWREEWFILYEDSTLEWYKDKGVYKARGRVRIADAPELLAVGEWTRQVPKRPPFPHNCHIGQLLAIGNRNPYQVHWLMAQSPSEVNDWMTAISNTLPPPPHLPLDSKRLSLTPERNVCQQQHQKYSTNSCHRPSPSTKTSTTSQTTTTTNTTKNYDADHTVLSGVVIDWGHGWGWGQNAMAAYCGWGAAHSAYTAETTMNSSLYCHTLGDTAVNGFDEVDWSAFGDFTF